MLRLFEHPLSPYARKVKIVLELKGVPYRRVFVNPLAADDPALREFLAISPLLEVPCLVDDDDGTAMFDSTTMLEYVEDKWPSPPALPPSPAERARVRMLEELCDTQLEAVNWGLMEVRFFRRADGAEAEGLLVAARAQLDRYWSRLDRELDGRPWMNGAAFGRGDAAVYPHITGAAFFGAPLDARHARLAAWSARCAEHPAVRADADQLGAWVRENMGSGNAAAGGQGTMPVVRQYRDHRLEWMMKSGGVEVVRRGLAAGTIKFQQEFGP
jgi:glutathione S-transferase/RNA polymerase-associated protein